ncbi:MAG: permease-like cell division protein FtsX [Thermoanaerobaculia bacterium]
MNFLQALAYFLREAAVGLARSLRVSLLAILTIAVSLFLSGALLLVTENLARTVRDWRAAARFVVYVARDASDSARNGLRSAIEHGSWTGAIEEVTPEKARERFTRAFPSLAELVAGRGEDALPYSFEAEMKSVPPGESARFDAWVAELRARPEVVMVDADQDWISQIETLLALVRGLGLALAAILLGASVFTIASVVRLTSFLYREEIAVMRLVGATEFYIRGPFYCEGILQGLLGGMLAVGALGAVHLLLAQKVASSLVAGALAARFLSPVELAGLVAFGGVAGWTGAVVSLSRESLAAPES